MSDTRLSLAKTVAWLLERGAYPSPSDDWGKTALQMANVAAHQEAKKLLE